MRKGYRGMIWGGYRSHEEGSHKGGKCERGNRGKKL